MPTGVYVRTPEMREAMKKNLAKGRLPEARRKAAKKLAELGKSEEWRDRVSERTTAAMRRPEVRKKHLKGLAKARKKHGITICGGNGREPVPYVKSLIPWMTERGFIREYPVKTRGHKTGLPNVPHCYKVDFGNPKKKVCYEIDGPSHRPRAQRILDKKKTAVLEALGWKVKRISHT